MPDRPAYKTPQFFALKRDIILYKDTSHVVFLGFGNDWTSVISSGGHLVQSTGSAQRHYGGFSPKRRIHYRYASQKLLTKSSERFINRKLKIYVGQLQILFGSSTATTMYHLSILERIVLTEPQLPMYFMILNSLLQGALKSTPLVNKFGQKIRVKFINVSELFHTLKNPQVLFRPKEVRRGEMTHRLDSAYKAIFVKVHAEVLKDVALHG